MDITQYKNIIIDPYLLGLWLGDGYSNGKEFSTNDEEILKYWEKWAFNNQSIVVFCLLLISMAKIKV